MARVKKLTHETLTELLDFNPATGVFTWKVARSNRIKVGSRAGVFHAPSGGRYISIGDEKFMAHLLAWFFVHAEWPSMDIRPIDGNYDHCAIENLKEFSRVELQHGRARIKTNTSGYQGVSAAKAGKWQSKITWNYRQIGLGANFDTAEEAGGAYNVALAALKDATCEDDIKAVVAKFRLEKNQRAIWNSLTAQGLKLAWNSFEEFSAEVINIPNSRRAMAATDVLRPIGPGNYRWATDGHPLTGDAAGKRAYARANRASNKDHLRDRDFRKKYGIDFGAYQSMLIEQKGVCAICEQPETKLQHGAIRMLSVDHNHSTNAVRGLLCSNCNLVLGYACDNPDVLRKSIAYLNRYDRADNVVKFEPSVVNGALGIGA